MKTPQQALAEEIHKASAVAAFHEAGPYSLTINQALERITKHFPPPSEDGIEEIAVKFSYPYNGLIKNAVKNDIKQAILADRQARDKWEKCADELARQIKICHAHSPLALTTYTNLKGAKE